MIWMNSRTVAHAIAIISTHDDGIPNNLDFFFPFTFLLHLTNATMFRIFALPQNRLKSNFWQYNETQTLKEKGYPKYIITYVRTKCYHTLNILTFPWIFHYEKYNNKVSINIIHIPTYLRYKNLKCASKFFNHTWIYFIALLRLNFSSLYVYLSDLSNYRLMEM